ncbi:unnamed protein product [Rotaria sp. Silwood1]|nr:unnamed protein product [Rotaria sp. Silwood1]
MPNEAVISCDGKFRFPGNSNKVTIGEISWKFNRMLLRGWVGWVGLGWVRLGWVGLGRVGLDRVRLGWVGLDWVGSSWVGSGWVELGWIGFGWVGSDQYDWKLLESLEYVLKPVVEATQLISGSQYPTIGISYFVIVQIRDFIEDSIDADINDWKILCDLKIMLLKQVQKYFIQKDEQWELMKNYSYFDPVGYGYLTRRERRAIEQYINELHEQYDIEETIDQQEVNQIQFKMNMKEKSKQSKSSSMAKFLNSIGKKNTSSQLIATTAIKKKLAEEMAAYRSLAQREYNSIIADEKDPDVVSIL